MSDEGPAFSLLCEIMGWHHIWDRHHLVDQIASTWQNLEDPDAYREAVIEILDVPTEDQYYELMASARKSFKTPKALTFLKKIEENKYKLVYAFTSEYFTVGHVSTQRSEGGFSAIKANGCLKKLLRQATYTESIERICQVAKQQDRDARDELMVCRREQFKVGPRYRLNLDKSKIASVKLSHVVQVGTEYHVKVNEKSPHGCVVNLTGTVMWKERQYTIITCVCPYFKSSLQLCPGACAAAQRAGVDIDDPRHVHPRFWIGFHPLYSVALGNLAMVDYEDAPWSDIMRVAPAGIDHGNISTNTESDRDVMMQARTQIYDSLGSMKDMTKAQRITKIRNVFNPCLQLAAMSPRNTKMACDHLTSNRHNKSREIL